MNLILQPKYKLMSKTYAISHYYRKELLQSNKHCMALNNIQKLDKP